MRKVLSLLAIFGMVFIGGFKMAEAATTDTFQITITINFIDMNLEDYLNADYGTWAIGQVAPSSVNTMAANGGGAGEEGILVDNNSNVSVDIECYVGDSGSWTLGAAIGADTYTLEAKDFAAWEVGPSPDFSSGVTQITATASPGNDIQTGLAANTDTYLYYRLTAPSSVSSGAQNTITVTVAATAS
ncbi:MAG: hypothetical protein AB1567_01005 [bacterium]